MCQLIVATLFLARRTTLLPLQPAIALILRCNVYEYVARLGLNDEIVYIKLIKL